MRLAKVSVSNYRRIPDFTVTMRGNAVLLGPNDSGKSSFLRALHLVLGIATPQLPGAVTARDFTERADALSVLVELNGLDALDRATFPDEIDVGPPEVLRVALEGFVDPDDAEEVTVRRFFPDAGHERPPRREQLARFGWAFVGASRSLWRELGGAGGGTVGALLAGIDLGSEEDAILGARLQLGDVVDESSAVAGWKTGVADALSSTLPREVSTDDLRLQLLDEGGSPLKGITVGLRDGDAHAPLAEQSDGVRALALLAMLGLSQSDARIIAVDEPEIHLHTTAQRAIARRLRSSEAQHVLATHSAAIAGEADPRDVILFKANRTVIQLDESSDFDKVEVQVRHWAHRIIDPLTARRILVVEGVCDRIVCDAVASSEDLDLDRHGISIFELDGATFFSRAHALFVAGFGLPVFGVVDEDNETTWAGVVGVTVGALTSKGFTVCRPDLEGMYVRELGVHEVVEALVAGGLTEAEILRGCDVDSRTSLDAASLANFCSHKKRKVRSALSVAPAVRQSGSEQFTELRTLLRRVTTA